MAMTPLQSVLWDVKQRIENDKKLSKLRQKVNSGKATYADTASYSTHVGNLLGDTFAQHILSVSPELREALTVELLHDRYMDINAIIDRVQKSMDEAQGLHLAPQHAPFYDDRAHQIGSALADPTVPDETIKRRARAATATATKSMHDDRMKSEAKFRSRAGLKCTVNRIAAAKCCEWCDQVAGKYAYEDTPPDLWRRHDNCNCTIVYGTRRDRQVLRGTEKKWEIAAEGVGAPEPVRLTPEQARKLQDKHQLKRLTNGEKHDIMNIRLDDIKTAVTGSPISEEVAEYIFSVLAEQRDQFKFDRVRVLALDPKIVMQTDPVQNGTFYDIVLNLNSNFLGGKTIEQLDKEIADSDVSVIRSLREAVIHEIYHARTFDGKNIGEVRAQHENLEGRQILGISPTAMKNGFECIAESGVLFERGEIEKIPEEARELLRLYLGVLI